MAKGKHRKRAQLKKEERDDLLRQKISKQISLEETRTAIAEDEAADIPLLVEEIESLREKIEERDRGELDSITEECRLLLTEIAGIALLKWTDSEQKRLSGLLFASPVEVFNDVISRSRTLIWERFPDAEEALGRNLRRSRKRLTYLVIHPEGTKMTALELAPRLRRKLSPAAYEALNRKKNAEKASRW